MINSPLGYFHILLHLIAVQDEPKVREFVKLFVSERFPTVLGLNKIDQKDSAKNMYVVFLALYYNLFLICSDKICARYGEDNIVLISALSECFLQKMVQMHHIYYNTGIGVLFFSNSGTVGDEDFKMFGEELSVDEKQKYNISESGLIPASTKMTGSEDLTSSDGSSTIDQVTRPCDV